MIRKLLILILVAPLWAQTATDLIISEYVEGSSYNKYLEIFNGTGNSVDLSQYQLNRYTNGSSSASYSLQLTGTLLNNSVFVVKHKDANISDSWNIESEFALFNGDDAVALVKNGQFVDIFGSIGEDPGSAWISGDFSTKDKTLIRKSSVTEGVTNPNTTGFPTLGTEWEILDQNNHKLGSHDFDGGVSVDAPLALDAENITDNGFSAKWNAVSGAVKYYIDLSQTADFSTFVDGYNNKELSNVPSYPVTGLNTGEIYYYRVRVQTSSGTSENSNVIQVQLTGEAQTKISFASRNLLLMESSGQNLIEVKIENPSSINSTNVEVVLTKGDTEQLVNFQNVNYTFEPNVDAALLIPFNTNDDEEFEELKYFKLEIKNITGGAMAIAGEFPELYITLVDDDQANHFMYNGLESYVEAELKTELHNLIKGHVEFPYTDNVTDTWDILKKSDQDPVDTTKVHLIYSGQKVDKDSHPDYWNREHIWAKSHGDFGTYNGAGTDLHHLRPANPVVNSSRSNLDFDDGGNAHSIATECFFDEDSWEPRDEVKGDIARMIFYMALRYEGESGEPDLETIDGVDTSPNGEPYHGNLSKLIEWNNIDPPSAFERRRNEIVYKYQKNRNPFIDNPNYINLIWNLVGIEEINEVPENNNLEQNYPNPFNPETNIKFQITVSGFVKLNVFNSIGQKVKTLVNGNLEQGSYVYKFNAENLPSGIYFYRLQINNFTNTKKMLLLK